MRRLDLKLVRDIRFSPWLFLGIVVVVTLGVALFDASTISYNSLGRSYDLTYERLNLADFTISMISAPEQVVQRIRRVPGIRQVEGRVVESTPVELDGGESRLVGRIVSLPDQGLPEIDSLSVVDGSLPRPGGSRDLMLEYSFARHHGLKPGSLIHLIIDENRIRFRVSGIFMSPEYILAVPNTATFGSEPEQFGVMFMRKQMMDTLFGSSGAVNQVVATIVPGADRDAVMSQVAGLLSAYAPDDPEPREQQPSNYLLHLDLRQLRILAVFFPTLFLTIASLSIYNLLSRMVISQRAQIGLMRAMGYGRADVLRHYISFAILIGLLGSVAGTYVGYAMAGWVANRYTDIVSVPYTIVALRYDIMALGVFIALAISVLAGLIPSRAASRLTPAEAIREMHATIGRVPVLEDWVPALRSASFTWRLPFRNLLRAPKRTLSTIAGVTASIALVLTTSGVMDSLTSMMDFYFDNILHYNAVVAFFMPRSESELSLVKTWTGVERAEPMMQVGVKLNYGPDQSLDVQLMGIERNSRLMLVLGPDRRPVPVPITGVAVGSDFMRTRGLTVGMPIVLSISQRQDPIALLQEAQAEIPFRRRVLSSARGLERVEVKRQVWITQATYQPMGNDVVMDIHELRRLFSADLNLPPNAVSGILVQADPKYLAEVSDRLHDLPGVATVINLADLREEIDERMKFATTFVQVMFSFAVVLAFVVLFNATTINILERTRETASLRALGSTRAQIAAMITIENLVTWAVGTLIGLPLGRWMTAWFMNVWQTETFHPRLNIYPSTYLLTVFGILLTVLVSQLPGIRYLNKLNLASATKEVTG